MGLFNRKSSSQDTVFPLVNASDPSLALMQYERLYEKYYDELYDYAQDGGNVPQEFLDMFNPYATRDAHMNAPMNVGFYLTLMSWLRFCEGALTIPGLPSHLKAKYRETVKDLRNSFDYDW